MLTEKLLITLTSTTCGFACWEAREEVCRCSCGGRNHGILRDGGEMPKRTCKIKGFWYELHAVGRSVYWECHDLRIAENGGTELGPDGHIKVYMDCRPGDSYHCRAAAPHQRKWPEVANLNLPYPYILWKRIKSPLAGGS